MIHLKISTPGVTAPTPVAPVQDTTCPGCGSVLRAGMDCEACGETPQPTASIDQDPPINIRASLKRACGRCNECDEAFEPNIGGLKCPVCGCFAASQKIEPKKAAHKVPEIVKAFKGEFGAQITEESTKIDMMDGDYRFKDVHVKGPSHMKIYTFYFGSDTDYVTIIHMKGKNRLFYYSTIWGLSDEMEEKVTGWMKEHGVINSAYFKLQQGSSDKFKPQIWKC